MQRPFFLRLLPNRRGQKSSNPRPDLDGPKGQILRQCILILQWVLKYNPTPTVRGDYKTVLVFIDLKSQAKFKVDLKTKKANGKAFREIAVMNGVHKLPYKCTVYSDGCGSMKHVKDSTVKMGIDYVKIPPQDQSLNEAEKVCNFMWASARTHWCASFAHAFCS